MAWYSGSRFKTHVWLLYNALIWEMRQEKGFTERYFFIWKGQNYRAAFAKCTGANSAYSIGTLLESDLWNLFFFRRLWGLLWPLIVILVADVRIEGVQYGLCRKYRVSGNARNQYPLSASYRTIQKCRQVIKPPSDNYTLAENAMA